MNHNHRNHYRASAERRLDGDNDDNRSDDNNDDDVCNDHDGMQVEQVQSPRNFEKKWDFLADCPIKPFVFVCQQKDRNPRCKSVELGNQLCPWVCLKFSL